MPEVIIWKYRTSRDLLNSRDVHCECLSISALERSRDAVEVHPRVELKRLYWSVQIWMIG